MNYDFAGWATKNDLKCSDGRTIRRDAFAHCDGMVVPMIYNHIHNDPNAVLGKALLKNHKDGVRAYCSFNDSETGRTGKELVQHGDITSLSIFANRLQQTKNGDVLHGDIREVSLVLAGANPGAHIDDVVAHGDDDGICAWICPEEDLDMDFEDLMHAEEEEETDMDIHEDTLSHAEADAELMALLNECDELAHADEESSGSGETIKQVFDTLSEKQKKAVYAIIGMALSDKDNNK